MFYEYFHGDTGAGVGASHQTGWTGAIARIMHTCSRRLDAQDRARAEQSGMQLVEQSSQTAEEEIMTQRLFYPSLYQINTRVWLTELSRKLGRPATLDDIPDAELDRLARDGL